MSKCQVWVLAVANGGGGGGWQSPDNSHREIFADLLGKKRKGKMEKNKREIIFFSFHF